MKALLLNTSFFPNIGGVENSLRGLCKVLNKKGWAIDVITSDCGKFSNSEQLFGANVIRYKQHKAFLFLFSMFLEILRVKPDEYDLVISRHTLMTFFLILLKVKNVNFIVPGIHAIQNKKTASGFLNRIKFRLNILIEKFVLKYSDNVFVFSNEMEKQIRFYLPNRKIIKVNPGIDIDRFYCSNKEKEHLKQNLDIPLNRKIIMSLGRFVDVKNFEVLIRSMHYLPNDYFLLLIGDGPNKEQYVNIIKEMSLSHQVKIVQQTNNPELYYRVSDVFCLPSTYEPFGQVLLEASFSHLIIVAIDSSCADIKTATKEIYDSYDSLIKFSTENTPKYFADTIKLASECEMNMDELQKFKCQYSWENLLSNILKINKV